MKENSLKNSTSFGNFWAKFPNFLENFLAIFHIIFSLFFQEMSLCLLLRSKWKSLQKSLKLNMQSISLSLTQKPKTSSQEFWELFRYIFL